MDENIMSQNVHRSSSFFMTDDMVFETVSLLDVLGFADAVLDFFFLLFFLPGKEIHRIKYGSVHIFPAIWSGAIF